MGIPDLQIKQFLTTILFIWTSLYTSMSSASTDQTAKIDQAAIMSGDVIVGGLFDIFFSKTREGFTNSYADPMCDFDSIDMYSVMEMEAVKWSLKRLNDIDFIPGIKLGMLAYPTCASPEVAILQANKILHIVHNQENKDRLTNSSLKGVIGATFSSETAAVSYILSNVPEQYRLPQISYASTADFLSTNLYPGTYRNFFRTIPSDIMEMKTMKELLIRLKWNYIAIIHSADVYDVEGALALKSLLSQDAVCVAAMYEFDGNFSKTRSSHEIQKILRQLADLKIKGAVFIGNSKMVQLFMEYGARINYSPGIIFSESQGLQNHIFKNMYGEVYPLSKGALVVCPPFQEIKEFSDHWKSIFTNQSHFEIEYQTNPWLKLVQNSHVDVANFKQTTYIKYAIMATYSMAKMIKVAHDTVCNGKQGMCQEFQQNLGQQMIDVVKRVSVDFTEHGDFGKAAVRNISFSISFSEPGDVILPNSEVQYQVYNFQKQNDVKFAFVNVGNYTKICTNSVGCKEKLSFEEDKLKYYDEKGVESSTYLRSVCRPGMDCSQFCLAKHSGEVIYVPGDVIVVVTFPIHNKGEEPLQCGDIRSSIGLDVALGAQFAVSVLNEDSTVFPDKKIGLLLIDTCNDPMLISERILELHTKGTISGAPLNISDKIIGYAGGFASTPTLQVAEITTEFKYVQVSCCATSDLLSDRLNYPYLVGLATPLNHTTDAMLRMVTDLSANFIQVIFNDGKYGESAVRLITSLAPHYNICIAQTVRIGEDDPISINSLISKLRDHATARIVLAFISSPLMPKVARVINDGMNEHEFRFIGVDGFNHREYLLRYPKLAGTLIVTEKRIPQSDQYKAFLRNISPTYKNATKSLVYFMQESRRCYYEFSFKKNYSRQCSQSSKRRFPEFLDPWTPYLIRSTEVIAIAAYRALKKLCPNDDICDEYRHRPEHVVQFLKNVTLDTDGDDHADTLFDATGNGNSGLKFFNIQRDHRNGLRFKPVGEWNSDDYQFSVEVIKPPANEIPSTYSTCTQPKELPARKDEKLDEAMGLVKTILLLVFALTIVVILFLFICTCRRQIYNIESNSGSTKSEVYNSIDDKITISMQRIDSDTSLRIADLFRQATPNDTPRTTRTQSSETLNKMYTQKTDSRPASCQNSPCSLPPHPQASVRRNVFISNRQKSDPMISTTGTPRRLHSEPLPDIPSSRKESLPYIEFPNTRRLNSEPTIPSPRFNRLLFKHDKRKESLQDNGYISPISGPDSENEAPDDEGINENNVVFTLGNDKAK